MKISSLLKLIRIISIRWALPRILCIIKVKLITFIQKIIIREIKKEENDRRWKSLLVVHQSNILANYLCLKALSLSPYDCGDYIVVKSAGIYMRNARNKILMRRIWMRRCSRRDCSSGWPPIQDLFSFLPSFRRQIMRFSLLTFFVVVEYIMNYFISFVSNVNR